MLDNFREWLSDNLRYILLGLAGILLLVIAFFAIRLISGLGSPKKTQPEVQQTTEHMTESVTEKNESGQLVRNQTDVLNFVTGYYTARANKDFDSLASMLEVYDDAVRAEIEREDALVESYSNIMTYSKPGLTDGSYVVYAYFDAKVSGANTLAPGLRDMYLITNSEGSLVKSDTDSHPEQQAYIEELRADSDVQALKADVDKKFEDAVNSDEDLKKLLSSDDASADTQGADSNGTGDGAPVVGTTTGTMQATTEVNVRGTDSAEGTLYGVLSTGMQVEVLENLDSGWSKISYTTNGTTIEGYVMTQYLAAVQ
ncbi:MAG: SH3 domain-containing protein [Lachnospiraceae bacterium]|nr:SH3 domain-containing protein [Lachnospiraceae bacterium]